MRRLDDKKAYLLLKKLIHEEIRESGGGVYLFGNYIIGIRQFYSGKTGFATKVGAFDILYMEEKGFQTKLYSKEFSLDKKVKKTYIEIFLKGFVIGLRKRSEYLEKVNEERKHNENFNKALKYLGE